MTLQTRAERREIYSVDGVRVTRDYGADWQCECGTHSEGLQCVHVARAAVFKQMRGVRRESDDTIELELTPSELQSLGTAAIVESTPVGRNGSVAKKRRLVHVSRWAAIATAAVVAGVSSGITYLATAQTSAAPLVEPTVMSAALTAPQPVASTETVETPVKIANPFDASEIFEFPSTMSESDARDAVADFLMQRARDRIGSTPGLHRHADQTSPRAAYAIDLAQRS
jgi:hypothetical protein